MRRNLIVLLILISIAAYFNTLLNDFVAGDRQFILRNTTLGDPHALLKSFTSDYWGILGGQSFVYFRPLTILTHFIDFNLYGLNPAGHHLSNIIFHTSATILIYYLFCLLLPSSPLAAFAGSALFALHPVHTHSVSYIMGRTDILAALFYIAALIFLINTLNASEEKHRLKKTVLACICFLSALLFKEMAITLPAVFLFYRLCWPSKKQTSARAFLFPFCLICLTALIYLLLRFNAVGTAAPVSFPSHWYNIWQRLALIFITSGFYLWKLILPFNLSYYSNLVFPGTWHDAAISPFFITGIMLSAMPLLIARAAPRACFAFAWIVCTLLPVLNIIQLQVLAKENYLYIPSVGFCLLFSILLGKAGGNKKGLKLCFSAFFFVGAMYCVLTLRKNNDYRDPVIFLTSTINNMRPIPSNLREDLRYFEGVKNHYTAYRNIGRLYMERGLWQKAINAFKEALSYTTSSFSPKYATDVKISLGKAYKETGELKKSALVLNSTLAETSRSFYVYNLLGTVSIKQNKLKKAEEYFKQAIIAKEDYGPAHHNLSLLYKKLNIHRKEEYEIRKAQDLQKQ